MRWQGGQHCYFKQIIARICTVRGMRGESWVAIVRQHRPNPNI